VPLVPRAEALDSVFHTPRGECKGFAVGINKLHTLGKSASPLLVLLTCEAFLDVSSFLKVFHRLS